MNKDLIKLILIGAALLLLLCVAPAVLLACINYLAEVGGSEFHIPHGAMTYLASWGLIVIFSASGSRK